MKREEFVIGQKFMCNDNTYLCTDIGTRIVTAIKLGPVNAVITDLNKKVQRVELSYEEATEQGYFNGPPYAVVEIVFDSDDMEGCSIIEDAPSKK